MGTIVQIAENTFTTDNGRGTELTLKLAPWGSWEVFSQNAATRAYNGNFGGVKTFPSLEEVEKNYKAFRGIVKLLAA